MCSSEEVCKVAFQYVKKDTALDKMNPLIKLFYMAVALIFVIQMTATQDIAILIIWILMALTWWIVGKVELSSLGFLLKLLTLLFVFLFLVQGLTYRFGDQTIFLKLFDLPIVDSQTGEIATNYGELTVGGLMYGMVIALRVISVVMVVPIFTMTSPMDRITASLAKVKVPQKIIFMFMTAMRFVPLVQESWDSIIEAQKIRGFDIEKANMLQKLRKAYVPIITPLLLLMFRRAMDLEVAINARAFGAKGERTYIEDVSFKARDYGGALAIILSFALVMYLKYFETTNFVWNYLVFFVTTGAVIVGNLAAMLSIDVLIQWLNNFILNLPYIGIGGAYFDQHLLTGYGGFFFILLVGFVIYKLGRRYLGKKKRTKQWSA